MLEQVTPAVVNISTEGHVEMFTTAGVTCSSIGARLGMGDSPTACGDKAAAGAVISVKQISAGRR